MATIEILMIEDDEGDAMLTRMALEEQSYPSTVTAFSTAKDALSFLRSFSLDGKEEPRIDLILLDGSLSDSSGLDLMLTLQGIPLTAQTPVVILTGSSSPVLQQAFRENGAAHIIEKSGDFNTLVENLAGLSCFCSQDMTVAIA